MNLQVGVKRLAESKLDQANVKLRRLFNDSNFPYMDNATSIFDYVENIVSKNDLSSFIILTESGILRDLYGDHIMTIIHTITKQKAVDFLEKLMPVICTCNRRYDFICGPYKSKIVGAIAALVNTTITENDLSGLQRLKKIIDFDLEDLHVWISCTDLLTRPSAEWLSCVTPELQCPYFSDSYFDLQFFIFTPNDRIVLLRDRYGIDFCSAFDKTFGHIKPRASQFSGAMKQFVMINAMNTRSYNSLDQQNFLDSLKWYAPEEGLDSEGLPYTRLQVVMDCIKQDTQQKKVDPHAFIYYMMFCGDIRCLFWTHQMGFDNKCSWILLRLSDYASQRAAVCHFHQSLQPYLLDDTVKRFRMTIYKSWVIARSSHMLSRTLTIHQSTKDLSNTNMDQYQRWKNELSSVCLDTPICMTKLWMTVPELLFNPEIRGQANDCSIAFVLLLRYPVEGSWLHKQVSIEIVYYILTSLWIESISNCTCCSIFNVMNFQRFLSR
ncbi:MAG: hypothetical protein JSS82_07800 [Bacteroidetes bacterium]|nr:hypothetical protein [Bacteroidota bacterium]